MKIFFNSVTFGIEMTIKQFEKLIFIENKYDSDINRRSCFCEDIIQSWFSNTSAILVDWNGHFGTQMIIKFQSDTLAQSLKDVETCKLILQEKLK